MMNAAIVAICSVVAWAVTAWVTINVIKTRMDGYLWRITELETWRKEHSREYTDFQKRYEREVGYKHPQESN